MFQENLKNYRKAKGLTQEDLAVRLHVVRQTISKWEKGLSVPDAALLGPPVRGIGGPRQPAAGRPPAAGVLHGQVAEQLARINEQLAQKTAGQAVCRWWWASCWPSSFYGGFFACSPTTPIPSTSPHQKFRWSRSPPFR